MGVEYPPFSLSTVSETSLFEKNRRNKRDYTRKWIQNRVLRHQQVLSSTVAVETEQHCCGCVCWGAGSCSTLSTRGGPDFGLVAGTGMCRAVLGPFILTSPVLTPGVRPNRFHSSYWQWEASTKMRSLTREPSDLALYNRLRKKLIVRPEEDDAAVASESAGILDESPLASSQLTSEVTDDSSLVNPWEEVLFPRLFFLTQRLSDFYREKIITICIKTGELSFIPWMKSLFLLVWKKAVWAASAFSNQTWNLRAGPWRDFLHQSSCFQVG